jgi:hypothetical protein
VAVAIFAVAFAITMAKASWIGAIIVGAFGLAQIAFLVVAILGWRRGVLG